MNDVKYENDGSYETGNNSYLDKSNLAYKLKGMGFLDMSKLEQNLGARLGLCPGFVRNVLLAPSCKTGRLAQLRSSFPLHPHPSYHFPL